MLPGVACLAECFYAWQRWPASPHATRDRQLRVRIVPRMMSEHHQAVAANMRARQFCGGPPEWTWVGDATEFATGSSAKPYPRPFSNLLPLHCALSRVTTAISCCGPSTWLWKRRCPDRRLLHHYDQGCTCASEDYRTRIQQCGITRRRDGRDAIDEYVTHFLSL